MSGTAPNEPITITVYLSLLIRQPGRYTRSAFGRWYECNGPDGKKYTNSSIASLRDVLKRKYGKDITINIIDQRPKNHRR